MAKKQKYYVVWQGRRPGIYTDWEACKEQVVGVQGAQYKSFGTLQEAEAAIRLPYSSVVQSNASTGHNGSNGQIGCLVIDENGMTAVKPGTDNPPVLDALAVDAACSGNPGLMEYQGIYIPTRTRLFHFQYAQGTNNIGEFLAIVHGLAYLKKHGLSQPLYTDSRIALGWVRQKECKSKLSVTAATAELWDYVHRAEQWLRTNTFTTVILKWDTDNWGEIPADFGRK